MPTTSNPARTKSAAVTDESTPPDIATTMRWSAGWPERSRSGSGGKAHRPEIGFEAGGGRKARGQRRDASLAAAPRELLVEGRCAVARQTLVLVTGVHVEPFAVRVALRPRRR